MFLCQLKAVDQGAAGWESQAGMSVAGVEAEDAWAPGTRVRRVVIIRAARQGSSHRGAHVETQEGTRPRGVPEAGLTAAVRSISRRSLSGSPGAGARPRPASRVSL